MCEGMYETQCQELCGHWGSSTQWEGMQDGLVTAHGCSTGNTVQEEMARSLKKISARTKNCERWCKWLSKNTSGSEGFLGHTRNLYTIEKFTQH